MKEIIMNATTACKLSFKEQDKKIQDLVKSVEEDILDYTKIGRLEIEISLPHEFFNDKLYHVFKNVMETKGYSIELTTIGSEGFGVLINWRKF